MKRILVIAGMVVLSFGLNGCTLSRMRDALLERDVEESGEQEVAQEENVELEDQPGEDASEPEGGSEEDEGAPGMDLAEENGGTRYQKSYGSYLILDGWIEVDRSTDTKSFYAKEGTENDPHPDNISVEVGTDPYSMEEHEEFGRAIQSQLAVQLSQLGKDTTLEGYGTTTEKGEIVYVFTIEESGKRVAVQYYIVGEQQYCMVYETIYEDEAECDQAAELIVESFEWAQ